MDTVARLLFLAVRVANFFFFFPLTPVTELYLLLNGQNMEFKRYLSIFVHELLLVTLLVVVLSGNTYKTFTVSNRSCMFLS